jgi:YVTN family beta-propeller protein
MPSAESILFKLFIVVLVVGGIIIVALVAPRFLPNPASITPSTTVLDNGQQATVSVVWNGGGAPYTVWLYGSTSGSCSESSPLAGVESNLTAAQFQFYVSPSQTTRYCGLVTSERGSSAMSSSALVTVNPALQNPTFSLSPAVTDTGQTMTVVATAGLSGGSAPYTVTLFSGSSPICTSDTTQVTVSSGDNPITYLAGQTATFHFAPPSASTYYCVSAINSAAAAATVYSDAAQFVVNPALAISTSPQAPALDTGQSIVLTASASQGTLPYKYQWYSGAGCTAPIAGQTSDTLSTGPLTLTTAYSVSAADNSTGTPAAVQCANVTVAVSSALTGTPVTIGPASLIDAGQKVSLTVNWAEAGTSPYTVKVFVSTSASCPASPGSAVASGPASSNSEVFTLSPTTTTYYCAVVIDGSATPESASTATSALVNVNPALTPLVVVSPAAMDTGQTETLTASVTVAGGTPTFAVTFRGGTSKTCADDPILGTSNSASSTYTIAAPTQSETFCAVVTDSAPTPMTSNSPFVSFTVNPALTLAITPPTPSVVSGKSISLSAAVSGGTSPFAYQWYTGSTCAASGVIAGQTSQAYSIAAATATGNYSVHVYDSSHGTPAQSACAYVTLTVTPALTGTLTLNPVAKDTGQTPTVTASVDISGGTAPYTVTLKSGSSSSCASDTTNVVVLTGPNPQPGLTELAATFTFASPTATTYYCGVITDSSTAPSTFTTTDAPFTVNLALGTPTMKLVPYAVLDYGQVEPLTISVTWAGGSYPYTVTVHSGSSSTCSADTTVVAVTSGTNPQTGVTTVFTTFTLKSPASTAYFCAVVTDSGSPPVSTTSATTFFLVNPPLSSNAPAVTPLVLDAGQSDTVTATVTWSGGTAPYTVTLRSGLSASCASDTAVVAVVPGSNPLTGQTVTSASFTFPAAASSTYYCVSVVDSSSVPVTALSITTPFVRNPLLSAALSPLSPGAVDTGQTATVTATITWSGGTAPFTVELTQGVSTSCSADTTVVGSAKTGLVGTSTTITLTSPSASTYYCATVTDSSPVVATSTTSSAQFVVNSPPTVTISPPSATIGTGERAPLLTANPSLGTGGYTYQWYTGSGCVNPATSETSATYSPGKLATTSSYSVKVTDSSTGTPSSISSACASVTIKAVGGPEGIASNPSTDRVYVVNPLNDSISVIDTLSNTVNVIIHTGIQPWGVTIDPTTNCVGSTCWGTIYVTNYNSSTVTLINGETNAVTTTIHLPSNGCASALEPEGVTVNPTMLQAYVADYGCNMVSVIDTNSTSPTFDTVITSVSVGSGPQSIAVGVVPYDIFVTDYNSATVSVITLTFNPTPSYSVTTVDVGSDPWGVAVDPATNLVYVTNAGSGTVTVINGTSFVAMASPISLGAGSDPEGISIDSATGMAYVADAGTNAVSVIDLTTNTVATTFTSPTVPLFSPWGVSVVLNANPTYPNLVYVTNAGYNTVTVVNLSTGTVVMTIPVP